MPSVTDNRILNCILFKIFNFLVPQKKKKKKIPLDVKAIEQTQPLRFK